MLALVLLVVVVATAQGASVAVHPEPVPYGPRRCSCEVDDHHDDHHEENAERLHELDHEMQSLIAKIEELSDHLEHKKHDRKQARAKASNLKLRLAKGDHVCHEGHYRCASLWEQCVPDLLVCDGHNDCDDGSDEDEHVCTDPLPVGAIFHGQPLYDHCTHRKPHHAKIEITGESRDPHFMHRKHVDARLYMEADHGVIHSVASLPLSGYYYYARHEVIFEAPEDDHLGIVGHFDPGHDEIFIAYVKRELSDEACAEFDLRRDDDHDHHHDEGHHDDDDDHHDDDDDHHDDDHDDDHHDDHDDDHHDDDEDHHEVHHDDEHHHDADHVGDDGHI